MVKIPNSMNELIYFTKRSYGEKGKVMAWAYKEMCPECKKGLMGKPVDSKGKVKIRAKEYECPECGLMMTKEDYEPTLTLEATYTCKKCGHEGEASIPFKRKTVKVEDEETGKITSCPAFVIICEKCGEKIYVTKKMKGE
jgi:predicted RNA-binding Zn-ribbon protein involved in translation (DUF1610 family)